jgi:hypothetical protein
VNLNHILRLHLVTKAREVKYVPWYPFSLASERCVKKDLPVVVAVGTEDRMLALGPYPAGSNGK